MISPDPIREAAAYQASLLAALGDDDPAEVQSTTADAMRTMIAEAAADLRVRPEPGEWSVLGCLDHMVDAEVVMAGRYRWTLAHDEPEIIGYDQDLWVARLHPDDEDPAALVGFFEPLRRANIALWARTSGLDRARIAVHRERGPESLDLMFRMLGGHDRVHLAQARRALESVRSA